MFAKDDRASATEETDSLLINSLQDRPSIGLDAGPDPDFTLTSDD